MKTKILIAIVCIFCYSLLPNVAMAVDTNSDAYRNGSILGKLVGFIIIGLVVFKVIKKILKK